MKIKHLLVALVATATLSGCTMSDSFDYSQADPLLRPEANNRFFTNNFWKGCLAGGAAGAGVGQLAGKDTKSTLIGAGIGCLLGGSTTAYFDNLRDKYKYKEQMLASISSNVNQDIVELRAVNSKTKQYIAKTEKEVKSLQSAAKQGRVHKAELEKKLKQYELDYATLHKRLDGQIEELQKYQKIRDQVANDQSVMAGNQRKAQQELAELDRKIDSLEKELQILELSANAQKNNIETLTSIMA